MADTPTPGFTPPIGIPKWAIPATPNVPKISKIGNLANMTTTQMVGMRMNVVRQWEKDFGALFSNISLDAANKFGSNFESAAKDFVKEFERSLYETIGRGIFEQFMKNIPNMPGWQPIKPPEEEPGPSDEEEKVVKTKWGKLMDAMKAKFNDTFGDLKDQLQSDFREIMGPLMPFFNTFKNVTIKLLGMFKSTADFLKKKILGPLAKKLIGGIGLGGLLPEGGGIWDTIKGYAGTAATGAIGGAAGATAAGAAGGAAAAGTGIGLASGGALVAGGALTAAGIGTAGYMLVQDLKQAFSSDEISKSLANANETLFGKRLDDQTKQEKKNFEEYLGPTSDVGGFLEGIWEKVGNVASNLWYGKPGTPGSAEDAQALLWEFKQKTAPETRTRATELMGKFQEQLGITKEAAAGLVGNVMAESGGKTTAFNPAGGGKGAFGLFQWRGSRQDALRKLAAEKGLAPESEEAQIAYLKKELESPEYAGLLAKMKEGKIAPQEFAKMIMEQFERPSPEEQAKSIGKRQSWAGGTFTGFPGVGTQIMNYAGTITKGVQDALTNAVANPSFGKSCGEQVTANINAGLEAAGGKTKLPESNLGVGIPNFLAKNYGVPLLGKEQITPEILRAMGPGTAIGFNRAANDPNRKWGDTHAEMTAINPATGQLEIASKSAEKGILWKKIDENYIKSLGYDARAANPFLSSAIGGQGAGAQIAAAEKQKAQAAAATEQQKLAVQEQQTAAMKALPKQIGEVQGAVGAQVQQNIIAPGARGGQQQREQQDLFSFDDPFSTLLSLSLSILKA